MSRVRTVGPGGDNQAHRYLRPPWTRAPPESKELLALCLKKIKGHSLSFPLLVGLKHVKLVDAEFVWTEPHSRRIKINVTIQKEVFNVVLQQSFICAFIIEAKTCEDCIMDAINHTYKAVVQLRQKVVLISCFSCRWSTSVLSSFWSSRSLNRICTERRPRSSLNRMD